MDRVPCVPGFAAGCGCGWRAAQGAAVFVLLVACLLRCGSPGGKGALWWDIEGRGCAHGAVKLIGINWPGPEVPLGRLWFGLRLDGITFLLREPFLRAGAEGEPHHDNQ